MDPLLNYIHRIYNINRKTGVFTIDVAKVAADLNTQVFIPDHRIILEAIHKVIEVPHTVVVNGTYTRIDVELIGK